MYQAQEQLTPYQTHRTPQDDPPQLIPHSWILSTRPSLSSNLQLRMKSANAYKISPPLSLDADPITVFYQHVFLNPPSMFVDSNIISNPACLGIDAFSKGATTLPTVPFQPLNPSPSNPPLQNHEFSNPFVPNFTRDPSGSTYTFSRVSIPEEPVQQIPPTPYLTEFQVVPAQTDMHIKSCPLSDTADSPNLQPALIQRRERDWTLKYASRRNVPTRAQKDCLKKILSRNIRPTSEEILGIAEDVGMEPMKVRIWFQNQRAQLKKRYSS